MSLRKIKKKFFIKISGNNFVQQRLEKKIKKLQRLTGVGSGGRVDESGEAGVIRKLKELKGSPYCVFDVGANKGDFAKLVMSCLDEKDSFRVHCFEPSKVTFDMLSANMKGDSNAVLNNMGLGKERGEFDFFSDGPGSGTASLTKRNLDYLGVDFKFSERVSIDTIDNYCSKEKIEHIDLLKIDVEGHELDVLDGAKNMFESGNIRMVTFEFGGCNIDTRTFFKDFYYLFKKYGFLIYRITPSGYFYPMPDYKEIHEQFATTNFLALHNS